MQPWPINPHTAYCMQILVEPPQDRIASNEILDAFASLLLNSGHILCEV